MGILLAWLLTVTITHLNLAKIPLTPLKLMKVEQTYPENSSEYFSSIKKMLHQQAPSLSTRVLDKAMRALKCSIDRNVEHNKILSVIDYSLPSNEKRLWIFDLQARKLLFHTFVS